MKLKELVEIRGNYTDAVDLKINFDDENNSADLIKRFLVSESSLRAIMSIVRGMDTNIKRERAHLITGSYGVGKSLIGLVIANIFARPQLPEIHDLIGSIKQDWLTEGQELEFLLQSMKGRYLPVLIQGNVSDTVNGALLSGLRDALSNNGLSNIIPKIAFDIAIDRIHDWRENDTILYKRFEEALEQNSYSSSQLEHELKNYNETALATFEIIHKTVTTAYFEYYKAEREPRDFYSQVVNELRSQNTEFCGIIIIWDEYGQTLKMVGTSQDHQSGVYLEEQHFCQYCKEKFNDQVHYVSIAHITQREYFSTEAAYLDYKKSSGRLTELLIEPQRGEEICGRAIVQLFEKNQSGWNDLRNNGNWQDTMKIIKGYSLYPRKDDPWIRNEIVEGSFPLHPITIYCLPRLSVEVSQLARTSLSFLNDLNGLAGFIKNDNNETFLEQGRLNFYTVDKLYGYFGKSIEDSKHRKIANGYIKALQYAGENILKIRILRTIAILQVVREPSLLTTKDTLFDCLYLTAIERAEFENAIAQLVEVGAIRERATGEFRLSGGGDYDYMEEFRSTRKVVQGGLTNPIRELNKGIEDEPSSLQASRYNNQYAMDRELDKEVVPPSSLSDILPFEKQLQSPDCLDGWVLWVVAQNKNEIQESKIRARRIRNKQILIAIPTEPTDILDKLVDNNTADAIENNLTRREVSLDVDDVEYVKEKADHYRNLLKQSVRRLVDPSRSTWFWQGNMVKEDLEDIQNLRDLVSKMMESVFPDTPRITQDRIAYKWASSQKKDRIQAMDEILDTHNPIQLKRSGRDSAIGAILKATLYETGLLKYKGHGGGEFDNYEVSDPETSAPAYKAWTLIANTIKKYDSSELLSGIVEALRLPPFGLSNNAIEVLLAAWIRCNWSNITITDPDSNIIEVINGDKINAIVNYPAGYFLIYEVLSNLQKNVLNCFLVTLTGKTALGGKVSTAEVTNRLSEWHNNLPPDRASADDISENAREILDAIGKTCCGEILIDDGLFRVIPELLGVPSQESGKMKQLPLDFANNFSTAIREIDRKEIAKEDIDVLKSMLQDTLEPYPRETIVLVLRDLLADYSDDKSNT